MRAENPGTSPQRRLLGRDDDHVPNADDHKKLALGAEIGVPGILGHDLAFENVAVFVLGAYLPERRPGADIAPADVRGHDRGRAGLLTDRSANSPTRSGQLSADSIALAGGAKPADHPLDEPVAIYDFEKHEGPRFPGATAWVGIRCGEIC